MTAMIQKIRPLSKWLIKFMMQEYKRSYKSIFKYGEGECKGLWGVDYVGIVGTPTNTTYNMSFVF